MDKRRFELVTFAAATEMRNSACALVHGKALREWFRDEQILAIAEQRYDGILSAAEQAMLTFARQTVADATATTRGSPLLPLPFLDFLPLPALPSPPPPAPPSGTTAFSSIFSSSGLVWSPRLASVFVELSNA